ncbi:hypothetical protein BDV28DRAFT_132394 [Aspergillus coremiiformis]|uniref:Uncharacterized protein n=1 Tax=Aspergillus coremiiformis TaxID=138285 RepID=A0A5N6Z862_9EURO|nr:hypothetical protein BDV28DRAFT_132394 [Aspergillus coremiiformis]
MLHVQRAPLNDDLPPACITSQAIVSCHDISFPSGRIFCPLLDGGTVRSEPACCLVGP